MSNPEGRIDTGHSSIKIVGTEDIEPPTEKKNGNSIRSRLRGYSNSARERISRLMKKDPEDPKNPIQPTRNSFEEETDKNKINRRFTDEALEYASSNNKPDPDSGNKLTRGFSLRNRKQ